MKILRNMYRKLFYLKKRERLPRIPRQYAVEYAPRQPHDIERAFKHTAARSPAGVELLMKRLRARTVDELIAKMPRRSRRRAAARLRQWMHLVDRTTPFEPVVKPYIRELRRQKIIDKRDRTIRRTKAPKLRL